MGYIPESVCSQKGTTPIFQPWAERHGQKLFHMIVWVITLYHACATNDKMSAWFLEACDMNRWHRLRMTISIKIYIWFPKYEKMQLTITVTSFLTTVIIVCPWLITSWWTRLPLGFTNLLFNKWEIIAATLIHKQHDVLRLWLANVYKWSGYRFLTCLRLHNL